MSKVSEIKQGIVMARAKGDVKLEISLLAELGNSRKADPVRPISTESAYGSMADSP